MLNETFYINGTDMRTLGVYLQRPIRISGLVPIVEKVHVEGRNGDLIFPTGAYENREGRADCFALSPSGDVGAVVTAVNALLMKSQGYVELKQSEYPNHFWKARITNGADIEQRLRTLNPFTIKFDIEPQHWTNEGQKKTRYNAPITTIKLQNNNSGAALPLIEVSGKGSKLNLMINDKPIEIRDIQQGIPFFIDSENKNVTDLWGANKNHSITMKEFPIFKQGENTITYQKGNSALYDIKIIPRWWDL